MNVNNLQVSGFGVAAEGDGINLLLFHVEHQKNGEGWGYRWRQVGSPLSGLGDWHEGWSRGMRVELSVPDLTLPVEVECRWDCPGGGEWEAPNLVRFVASRARFLLAAKEGVYLRPEDGLIVVTGIVREAISTWRYPGGELEMDAGTEIEVEMASFECGFETVLFAAGDFVSHDSRLSVRNVAASEGGIELLDGEVKVSLAGRAWQGVMMAIGPHGLDPLEREMLETVEK